MKTEKQNAIANSLKQLLAKVDVFVSTSAFFKPRWIIIDIAIIAATVAPRIYSAFIH